MNEARKAVFSLYRKMANNGGWRAVAKELGLPNVRYAYAFVKYGTVPANPDLRRKVLRAAPPAPKRAPLPAFERHWRALPKAEKDRIKRREWKGSK